MTLGLVKMNSCMTSKLPIVKKKLPCDNRIRCRQFFSVHSKYLCNLITIYSFFDKLFTVTGNITTMYSKNRIGNRKFHSKLPIIGVFLK